MASIYLNAVKIIDSELHAYGQLYLTEVKFF